MPAGANALALAVDPLNPVRRVYHPIPFNSALAYRYSSWMKASDTGVNQRVWLDWVHLNDGSAYGSNAYSTIGGNTGWRPFAVPPHVLPLVDHSSDPNAEFCIVLELSSNGTSTAWFDDVMVETTPMASTAFTWVRLLLGGPYTNGYMPANLRLQNLLPALEPYTALGYAQAGGGGGEVAPTAWWSFNNLDGPVDWVRVELRSAMDPTVVVATRQGLLSQQDSVTGVDGGSAVAFNVSPGNYYVAVRHRNHLHDLPTVFHDFGKELKLIARNNRPAEPSFVDSSNCDIHLRTSWIDDGQASGLCHRFDLKDTRHVRAMRKVARKEGLVERYVFHRLDLPSHAIFAVARTFESVHTIHQQKWKPMRQNPQDIRNIINRLGRLGRRSSLLTKLPYDF